MRAALRVLRDGLTGAVLILAIGVAVLLLVGACALLMPVPVGRRFWDAFAVAVTKARAEGV